MSLTIELITNGEREKSRGGKFVMVTNILNGIQIIIEMLYYISGPILAIGVIFAYKQLVLVKNDIKTKNQRSAVEKSVEYMDWYANVFIPEHEDFKKKLRNQKDVKLNYNFEGDNFKFPEPLTVDRTSLNRCIVVKSDAGFVSLANQLEFFSYVMTNGLADEEQVFLPIGELFVDFMNQNQELYCQLRDNDNDNKFSYSVKLYKLWNNRIEREKLDKQAGEIEEKRSSIKTGAISYIGKQ